MEGDKPCKPGSFRTLLIGRFCSLRGTFLPIDLPRLATLSVHRRGLSLLYPRQGRCEDVHLSQMGSARSHLRRWRRQVQHGISAQFATAVFIILIEFQKSFGGRKKSESPSPLHPIRRSYIALFLGRKPRCKFPRK